MTLLGVLLFSGIGILVFNVINCISRKKQCDDDAFVMSFLGFLFGLLVYFFLLLLIVTGINCFDNFIPEKVMEQREVLLNEKGQIYLSEEDMHSKMFYYSNKSGLKEVRPDNCIKGEVEKPIIEVRELELFGIFYARKNILILPSEKYKDYLDQVVEIIR